jgi:hypothetical protein
MKKTDTSADQMLSIARLKNHPILRVTGFILSGLLLLGPIPGTLAQERYEAPPVLSASKILPPELLAGPNHAVQERVINDGFLNTYKIDSKFGTFTAVSTAMLRKRIGEINAMVRMEQIKGTKEYASAIKQAGLDMLGSMKNLLTSPVDTVSGAVGGLGAAFRRVGDSISGPKRSQSEDSSVKDLIGFSTTKRDYAYKFDVDAYSDNEKLQDRLNEITWAGFAGSLTWSAAMMAVPGGAGIAISIAGSNKLLNQIFQTTPPVELRRMNGEKLKAMDVHPEIADAFLNNALFSPRQQTILVNALNEMKSVANRAAFVRLALVSSNPIVAYFRQRQAEMYEGFHRDVTPIESFVALGDFAAARTKAGALVFNVPLDYLAWTEPIARLLTGANQLVTELPGIKDKQLWLAGTLSARARKEIESRGWQVQEQTEARLFGWTESYPNYQRPEERIPTGFVSLNFKSVALGVGGSSGDGVLTYQGKDYPFSISGVSFADVGVSSFSGAAKVYDLKSVKDFAGNYAASQASFAVGGGGSEIAMKNSNGVTIVVLKNEGKESGTKLSLGPGGMKLQMK